MIIKNATFHTSKKFLGPVHLHPKTDKWDYLLSPIMKKKSFLVLTSGKFLEALGSGIGTGSIFCLSFSLSNRVMVIELEPSFWNRTGRRNDKWDRGHEMAQYSSQQLTFV